MDFNNYYLQQANQNYFRGAYIQKGFGLGGAFRRFFSWFIPLLKDHTLPVVKNIGKEVVQSVANIATDTISGKNIEESSKQRITESLEKINQTGKGYKKKKRDLKKHKIKNISKKSKKRQLDIFG